MAGIFGLFKGLTSSGKKSSSTTTNSTSSKSSLQTPTHTEAIASIRETVEILQKKEQEIERRIEEEHNKAKSYVTKNKNIALIALKKKKALETQLASIQASVMRMEEQALQLETVVINEETTKALRKSLEAQKIIQSKVTVEDIETVVDDLREFRDRQRDYDAAIQSLDDNECEEDINNELDILMQESVNEELDSRIPAFKPQDHVSYARIGSKTSSVYGGNGQSRRIMQLEDDDERDLEELRKSLAM